MCFPTPSRQRNKEGENVNVVSVKFNTICDLRNQYYQYAPSVYSVNFWNSSDSQLRFHNFLDVQCFKAKSQKNLWLISSW